MKLCLQTIIKIRAHTGIVSPSAQYTRNSHRRKRGQYIWPCAANNMSMALPGFIRSAFCILNDARWSIVVERLTYACRVVLEVITWLKYKILDTVSHYIYMSKIDLKLNSVCDEDVIERSGQTRASDLRGCQAAAKLCCLSPPRDVIRTLLCNCPPKDGVFSLLELLSHKTVSIWLAGKCRLIHNWL